MYLSNGNLTRKKVIQISVTVFIFMITVFCIPAIAFSSAYDNNVANAESTVSEWDGTTKDTSWYDNNVDASEYTINTASELAGLAAVVNAGNKFADKTVKLASDIDLLGNEWTPIGSASATPFCGVFDGGNHVINNLNVSSNSNFAGLFGRVGANEGVGPIGTVKNVTVCNVNLLGNWYAGTIAGVGQRAVIENCDVIGDINISGYAGLGGIVGNGIGTIKNCNVSGNITIEGSAAYVGGIAGNGYYSVENCHVDGLSLQTSNLSSLSYLGGIQGFTGEGTRTVINCSVKNLSLLGTDTTGGIIGMLHYGITLMDCSLDSVTLSTTGGDGTVGTIAGTVNGTATAPSKLYNNTFTNTVVNGDDTVTTQTSGLTSAGVANVNYFVGSSVVLNSDGKIISGTFSTSISNEFIADVSCGKVQEGVYVVSEHVYSELKNNESEHWYECANCGVVGASTVVEHFGGSANCMELAVCEVCNVTYGEIDVNSHKYGTPNYVWADDYSTCTATRICMLNGEHSESESVANTAVVTPATCLAKEYTTYIATFTNGAFAIQVVENIETGDELDHEYGMPTYIWAYDYSTCVATRVCMRDEEHVEIENAVITTVVTPATCLTKEYTTYTATFIASEFVQQIAENVVTDTELGHDFGENWLANEEHHYHACSRCDVIDEEADHGYDNACDELCNVCDYVREISHDYSVLKHSATEHWYECVVCNQEKEESRVSHFGGTATCSAKPACSVCDVVYGTFGADNHVGGTELRDVIEVGTINDGYTGNTYCLGCDELLEQGKDIPMLGVAIDIPTDNESQVQVGVIIDGNDAVIDAIDKGIIESVVSSKENTNTTFSIDISKVNEEIDAVSITKDSIENFVEIGKENALSVNIAFSNGNVTLDNKTLETVLSCLKNETLKILVNSVDVANLNDEQQAAIANRDVYVGLSVKMIFDENETAISDFEGGLAQLSVAFEVPTGKNANDFAVWYIAEDGTKTKLNTWYENGQIVWEVGHFSDFVIIYTNPKTVYVPALISSISLAVLIVTLCIAFVVARKLKEKEVFEASYNAYYKEYYKQYKAEYLNEYNKRKYPKIKL